MPELPDWQPATAWNKPVANAVDLWRIKLDQQMFSPSDLWDLLSNDERIRAERYYFERDYRRFIIGRASLRLILAKYLSIKPHQLQFNYTPNGKPFIPGFEFNFSNSQELGLLGISQSSTIGIDVEKLRPIEDLEQIAVNFYSHREITTLMSLPLKEQPLAFLNAWTRKEAYLKAIGKGLSRPLSQVEVSLKPTEPAQFLSNLPELAGWSLESFTPESGFVAAIALHSLTYKLEFFSWP